MNYINLTPHQVDIIKMDGTTLSIPSSGEPIGVPETLEPDTIYIVSKLALESCRSHGIDTSNFLIPGELIRDDTGRIIGCESLSEG